MRPRNGPAYFFFGGDGGLIAGRCGDGGAFLNVFMPARALWEQADADVDDAGQQVAAHDMAHGDGSAAAGRQVERVEGEIVLQDRDSSPLGVAFGVDQMADEGVCVAEGGRVALAAYFEPERAERVGLAARGAYAKVQVVETFAAERVDGECERVAAFPAIDGGGAESVGSCLWPAAAG